MCKTELNPSEHIKKLKAPVLVLAGDKESQLSVKETKRLFENCSSKQKHIYFFKGGKHEDFLKNFKDEYQEIIFQFLKNSLVLNFNQVCVFSEKEKQINISFFVANVF